MKEFTFKSNTLISPFYPPQYNISELDVFSHKFSISTFAL